MAAEQGSDPRAAGSGGVTSEGGAGLPVTKSTHPDAVPPGFAGGIASNTGGGGNAERREEEAGVGQPRSAAQASEKTMGSQRDRAPSTISSADFEDREEAEKEKELDEAHTMIVKMKDMIDKLEKRAKLAEEKCIAGINETKNKGLIKEMKGHDTKNIKNTSEWSGDKKDHVI